MACEIEKASLLDGSGGLLFLGISERGEESTGEESRGEESRGEKGRGEGRGGGERVRKTNSSLNVYFFLFSVFGRFHHVPDIHLNHRTGSIIAFLGQADGTFVARLITFQDNINKANI